MGTETLVGFRFCPTPEEIVGYYLLNKVNGMPLPVDVIMECNIYGEKEEWMKVFEERKENSLFFFTKLKKKSDKGKKNIERVSGCGTWKETQRDKKIYIGKTHIGSRRGFKFLSKQGDFQGIWLMDEYRLDGDLLHKAKHNDYVVCHIKHVKELRARGEDFNQEDISHADTNLPLEPELAINSEYVEPPSMGTTSREPEVMSRSVEGSSNPNIGISVEDLDEFLLSWEEPSHPSPETIKSFSTGTINMEERMVEMEVQMVDNVLAKGPVSPPPQSTLSMSSESNAVGDDEFFCYQQQLY